MPVPSTAANLSTTAASNYPSGSESIGTSLDDYLRSTQAIIKQQDSKGSDIASSSTITVPNSGKYFVVTGTTTITAIADSWIGRTVVLRFSGALTLTHSSGLILPSSANITTAAGDTCFVTNESTGVWRCVSYQPAAGLQPFDADTAKTDVAQNFTLPQRSALLTDNDLSFDLSAKQNFKCTPTAGGALTFTNQADGLSGFVILVNGSNYAITAHANTKISTAALDRISATGTYRIDYASDGTNTYCTASEALA